ncbi:MAG: BrnT family toxin [Steroidobacteraceae bacterium]
MGITYDPEKCARNVRERALSFEEVEDFEWNSAYVLEDARKDYGERRFQALGEIGGRVYMLVFTPRGRDVHVISVRKANRREIKRYEEERAIEDE